MKTTDAGGRIVLGVTGGIAIYKGADLCSKLTGVGYDVHVVMTANALKLMSARCFFTLSRNTVVTDLFANAEWRPEHVELADSDLMIVAPCTANFIGKYTHGIADDALTATAMAFRGPLLLAPAMNANMWNSPAVMENIKILRGRGVEFVGPEAGRLACGTEGTGRMSEPSAILSAAEKLLKTDSSHR